MLEGQPKREMAQTAAKTKLLKVKAAKERWEKNTNVDTPERDDVTDQMTVKPSIDAITNTNDNNNNSNSSSNSSSNIDEIAVAALSNSCGRTHIDNTASQWGEVSKFSHVIAENDLLRFQVQMLERSD